MWIKTLLIMCIMNITVMAGITLYFESNHGENDVIKIPSIILFESDSLYFDRNAKIDSLFHFTLLEINRLPLKHWIDNKNCEKIIISKKIFSLFSKSERDSLFALSKQKTFDIVEPLNIADTLFSDNIFGTAKIEEIACSIYIRIEQQPNKEYIMYFNENPYLLAKRTEVSYSLRRAENKCYADTANTNQTRLCEEYKKSKGKKR